MSSGINKKSSARQLACQVLYQIKMREISDIQTHLEAIEEEIGQGGKDFFKKYDLDTKPDKKLFKTLILGVSEKAAEIEQVFLDNLDNKNTANRIGKLMRSVFDLAIFELKQMDTPKKVVIDEYMKISRGFFSENELKLINGVLDSCS